MIEYIPTVGQFILIAIGVGISAMGIGYGIYRVSFDMGYKDGLSISKELKKQVDDIERAYNEMTDIYKSDVEMLKREIENRQKELGELRSKVNG